MGVAKISGALIAVVFLVLTGTYYFFPEIVERDSCRSGSSYGAWEAVTDTVYFSDEFPAIGRYYCSLEAKISIADCLNLDRFDNVPGCKWGGKTSGGKHTMLYVMVDPTSPTNVSWLYPLNESYIGATSYYVNWTNSTDVDGGNRTYLLEIDDVADFSSLNYRNATINETANPTGVWISGLSNGTLYARILATDGALNSSWRYRTWVQNNITYEFVNVSLHNSSSLTFLANASVAACVPALNQTNDFGIFRYFNTEGVNFTIESKINVSSNNVTFGCWSNSSCDSRVVLNSTYQTISNVTNEGTYNYIWCWANFSNASSFFINEWSVRGRVG